MQQAEVLVADIGSTLTKLSAFSGLAQDAQYLGQGLAITTVKEGDVTFGLEAARRDLETQHSVQTKNAMLLASSSAAGGLRMSVHGLTRDMTLRAAKEASLGAGAIVVFTSAGLLSESDLDQIRQLAPKLILLAGGVDDGDRDVVLANARSLARLGLSVPLIYAGNNAAKTDVLALLGNTVGLTVFATDNVYPRIDELNVEPVRELIQSVFAKHIVTAPGMNKIKARLDADVMPTPAAVMRATELIADEVGDVLVVDVGGATTDIHSVIEGSSKSAGIQIAPEPRSKRTVEGDLGVYLNAGQIIAASGASDELSVADVAALPDEPSSRMMACELCRLAVDIALWRHAGEVRTSYGVYGREKVIEGRDLSAIKVIIGTGGALTKLGCGRAILQSIKPDPRGRKLLPPKNARVLLDQHYLMAAVGVLSQRHPNAARKLLLESISLSA